MRKNKNLSIYYVDKLLLFELLKIYNEDVTVSSNSLPNTINSFYINCMRSHCSSDNYLSTTIISDLKVQNILRTTPSNGDVK